MHPNSLKNIEGKAWNSETAKEAQLRGAAARKANRIARENLKLSVDDWSAYKTDVLQEEGLSAVDVLKVLMHKALLAEEYDTAADLAKSIAEFEQPKLARVEQVTDEVSPSELSDEELARRLLELSDATKRELPETS